MYPRQSPRSEATFFPESKLPMGIPTIIRVVSSTVSFSSAITLDDDDLLAGTVGPIHQKPKLNTEAIPLPPIPSPPRESNTKSRRSRRLCSPDGLTSQSEHIPRSSIRHDKPVTSMTGQLDTPPINPKILVRRSTEPLGFRARKACLQDLGYLEQQGRGRKTMLVSRFSPRPSQERDDYLALPTFLRGSSDESYASMPLRMPVRKASNEDLQLVL